MTTINTRTPTNDDNGKWNYLKKNNVFHYYFDWILGRRCSLIILSSTIVFILITVIVGLCVRFLIQGKTQSVILIILICVLVVVGTIAVTILEIRRRRTKKIIKQAAPLPAKNNYKAAPTAPPISTTSSWNYKNFSNRSTMQA